MTVEVYNKEFTPKIRHAMCLVNALENALKKTDDYEGAMKQFKILGWSDDMKDTLLRALACYQVHEGIERLERRSDEND